MVTYDADFPLDMGQYQLINTNIPPNYLCVGNTQPECITVVHNSFDKLEDWGILFSEKFQCKVIMVMAQSTSDAYYFALYDHSQKRREIETCYGADFAMINEGEPFDFEGPYPGEKSPYTINNESEEASYLFDFDSIERYCSHFGLQLEYDYSTVKWTILKGNVKREIDEYLKKLGLNKKPWWKFW